MSEAATPCEHCNGTGELFIHADDCDDDLCALNGDEHSCVGQLTVCQCNPIALLREFVREVKAHAYAPQFEHMGPLVLTAERVIAAAQQAATPAPAEPTEHGQLDPEMATETARAALGYAQAFGPGINWQSDEPWPHRIELAQALDWITELGAMVLNLADRVAAPPAAPASQPRGAFAAQQQPAIDATPVYIVFDEEVARKVLEALSNAVLPCSCSTASRLKDMP